MMLTLNLALLLGTASAFMVAPLPATRAAASVRAPVMAPTMPRLAKLGPLMQDASADSTEAEAAAAPAEAPASDMTETLVTGGFFGLWYLFNIGYNIYNKKALNALPIPYTMATLQLFVGIPYVCALWLTGLRKAPKLSVDNVKTLIPVSLGHLGTHIGAVVSLGAGAVSFTHIIKASEPVVSAALSFVLLGAVSSWQTYLTLLPIVGGVALASLKELSFTWVGFIAAMGSNVCSALRGILGMRLASPPHAPGQSSPSPPRPPPAHAPPRVASLTLASPSALAAQPRRRWAPASARTCPRPTCTRCSRSSPSSPWSPSPSSSSRRPPSPPPSPPPRRAASLPSTCGPNPSSRAPSTTSVRQPVQIRPDLWVVPPLLYPPCLLTPSSHPCYTHLVRP